MSAAALVLALLLAMLPLMEGGASATGLFCAHTAVFLLAAIAIVSGRRRGRIAIGFGWEAAAGLLLVGWMGASWLLVEYRFGSFLSVWDAVVAALLAAVLLVLADQDRGWNRVAAVVVAAASGVEALYTLLVPAPPNLTPSGTFANANQLAAYLDIGTFVAAALAVEGWRSGGEAGRWRAAAPAGIVLLNIAALMRIGSRGGAIALLVGAFVWVMLVVPRGRPRRAAWAALALLVLMSAVAVTWRFERLGDPYRFDRLHIWEASLRAAGDHPLLGMGPGMFERLGYRYNFPLDREMFRYAKNLRSTHSAYLQAAVEWGAVGLALTLLFVVLLMRRTWARPASGSGPLAVGAALALLSCLILGVVDTPFAVPAVTLSLVALIAPRVAPAEAGDADVRVVLYEGAAPPAGATTRRGMLAASGFLLAVAWLGAVAIPYAADRLFLDGMTTRALQLNPYNPLYWTTRAESLLGRDRRVTPDVLALADPDLERASRLDPVDPLPLLDRARLHARAWFEIGAEPAAATRAIGFYRQAIGLGIRDPRPRLELGTFLMAVGREDEAMDQIDEAIRLEPNFLAARMARARALLERGDRDAARRELAMLREAQLGLKGYVPRNGYEADLMKLDASALARLEARLT